MNIKKLTSIGLCISLLTVLLAGCGNGKPTEGSEPTGSYSTRSLGNISFQVNDEYTLTETSEPAPALSINIEKYYGFNINLLPTTGNPTKEQYQEMLDLAVSQAIEENGLYDYNVSNTTIAGRDAARIIGTWDIKGEPFNTDIHIFGDSGNAEYFYVVMYNSRDPERYQDAYTELLDSIKFTQDTSGETEIAYDTYTSGNITFLISNQHAITDNATVTLSINVASNCGINYNLLPITGDPTEEQYQALFESTVERIIEENGLYDYTTEETVVAGQSAVRINGLIDSEGDALHTDIYLFGDNQYFYMFIYYSLEPETYQDTYTELLESIELTDGNSNTGSQPAQDTELNTGAYKTQVFNTIQFTYDDQYELVSASDSQIAIRFEPGVDSVNLTSRVYAEAPSDEDEYARRLEEVTNEAKSTYALYEADTQSAAVAGQQANKVTAKMDVDGVSKAVEMYILGCDRYFYAVFHVCDNPETFADEFESLLASISLED